MENQILYKYRGTDEVGIGYHLDALSENYIWAADIQALNDPCEAMICTNKYFEDLTSMENMVSMFGDVSASFQTLREKVDGLLKKAASSGIFSLTKNHSDELMWSHYGMSHQGFCIGYNMKYLERSFQKYYYNILEVVYSEHPPVMKMLEQWNSRDRLMGMKQLLATKSLRWSNESEVRLVTSTPGKHQYDYRSVAEIYFGLRMSERHRLMIMEKLQGRNIKYFRMQMSKDLYEFFPVAIEDAFADAAAYHSRVAPVQPGAVSESTVQQQFRQYAGYLSKAVEVARREPFCIEVSHSGFRFGSVEPIVYVHCKRNDIDYGNFEYTLQEIDFLYGQLACSSV